MSDDTVHTTMHVVSPNTSTIISNGKVNEEGAYINNHLGVYVAGDVNHALAVEWSGDMQVLRVAVYPVPPKTLEELEEELPDPDYGDIDG